MGIDPRLGLFRLGIEQSGNTSTCGATRWSTSRPGRGGAQPSAGPHGRTHEPLERIEATAAERIERNPHSGDAKDVTLVMMLFEAARLATETEGAPVAERRRRHRRPVTRALED